MIKSSTAMLLGRLLKPSRDIGNYEMLADCTNTADYQLSETPKQMAEMLKNVMVDYQGPVDELYQ